MSIENERAKFAQKKNDVIMKVAGIVKTGKNETQHYNYAEEAEVVKELRKALAEAKLSFSAAARDMVKTHDIPTRSGSMAHFTIQLTCSLTDTETGYMESYDWLGAAADSGDKALYKAFTSGCKYFLMKNFLLPTGDDVESFSDVDEKPENKKTEKPTFKKTDQPAPETSKKSALSPEHKAKLEFHKIVMKDPIPDEAKDLMAGISDVMKSTIPDKHALAVEVYHLLDNQWPTDAEKAQWVTNQLQSLYKEVA